MYKSTERAAIGQPVGKIAGTAADTKMQVNRINVYAIGLLQKDQAPQADLALAESAEARSYESVHPEQSRLTRAKKKAN